MSVMLGAGTLGADCLLCSKLGGNIGFALVAVGFCWAALVCGASFGTLGTPAYRL